MGNISGAGLADRTDLLQADNWCYTSPVARDGFFPVWCLLAPEGKALEALEVIEEIIPANREHGCYELERMVDPGDLWVDVGSHLGIFSIAVMQHGGQSVLMVDMDQQAMRCASWNTRQFAQLVEAAMGLPSTSMPSPYPSVTRVENVHDIERLIGPKVRGHTYGIKLDVQGAEETILTEHGSKRLGTLFDKLIVEWHDVDTGMQLCDRLEAGGWRVQSMREHEDVLLGIDTYIVTARQDRSWGAASSTSGR